MATSGKPIHVALAQSMDEPGYEATRRMPVTGVHLSQSAIDNGLDGRMMLAYTAYTEPDAGGPDIVPGYQAETDYYPAGTTGPRVRCEVQPVWHIEYEEEPALVAFRTTVSVDGKTVGSAYVEVARIKPAAPDL